MQYPSRQEALHPLGSMQEISGLSPVCMQSTLCAIVVGAVVQCAGTGYHTPVTSVILMAFTHEHPPCHT